MIRIKKSYEQQMEIFKELGFQLNKGVENSDVDRWGNKAFEKETFSLLYITLGMNLEREPWTPMVNNLWTIDTELITDVSEYVNFMKRLQLLVNNEFNFSDIKAEESDGFYTVKFMLNTRKYEIKLKKDEDWLDLSIFEKIENILESTGTKKKFTFYDPKDQTIVVGWESEDKIKEIKKRTKLKLLSLK